MSRWARMRRKHIKDFTLSALKKKMRGLGVQHYRAEQIFSWIYKKGAGSFGEMNNLPRAFRKILDKNYCIRCFEPSGRLKSKDGSEKFLFRMNDGVYIESVCISSGRRKTLCLSTQAGCKYSCPFCASGMSGFRRDLTPSEILNQILFIKDKMTILLTNYVFMGMGEPLDNYDNLEISLRLMNDKSGLAIGGRRITVSTCGVVPGIKKLAGIGIRLNLSISLHATTDELRDRLVPANKKYPLGKLMKACAYFFERTGKAVTLEYTLMGGINDGPGDAARLCAIAGKLGAKVNLILCSPVLGWEGAPCPSVTAENFRRYLKEHNVVATLRGSKGLDIQAACGQLALTRKREKYSGGGG